MNSCPNTGWIALTALIFLTFAPLLQADPVALTQFFQKLQGGQPVI